MPNNKHIVKIDKDQKRLKRIFDDLTVHRECIIDSNSSDWHIPIQHYGRIVKNKRLVDEGFLEPMWIHSSKETRKVEKRLIRLKPDTEIIKIDGNSNIFFKFRRRKII